MSNQIYSINVHPYGHFNNVIIVKENLSDISIDNMAHFIYFDNEEDAKDFKNKLQEFIKSNYKRAFDENWYDLKACD